MDTLYGVILAGGKGERLWPLSRQEFPKQLLHISQKSAGITARLVLFSIST